MSAGSDKTAFSDSESESSVSEDEKQPIVLEEEMQERLLRAARVIKQADAILVATGAGHGHDGGLPTFRGKDGFWKAYPPMRDLNIPFTKMSSPAWFEKDPTLAFGFWAHRWNLYTKTPPHDGYRILKELGSGKKIPLFSFTSNVDAHFRRAGFDLDHLCECHGPVALAHCREACSRAIWPSEEAFSKIEFDEKTFRAVASTMPRCPNC